MNYSQRLSLLLIVLVNLGIAGLPPASAETSELGRLVDERKWSELIDLLAADPDRHVQPILSLCEARLDQPRLQDALAKAMGNAALQRQNPIDNPPLIRGLWEIYQRYTNASFSAKYFLLGIERGKLPEDVELSMMAHFEVTHDVDCLRFLGSGQLESTRDVLAGLVQSDHRETRESAHLALARRRDPEAYARCLDAFAKTLEMKHWQGDQWTAWGAFIVACRDLRYIGSADAVLLLFRASELEIDSTRVLPQEVKFPWRSAWPDRVPADLGLVPPDPDSLRPARAAWLKAHWQEVHDGLVRRDGKLPYLGLRPHSIYER